MCIGSVKVADASAGESRLPTDVSLVPLLPSNEHSVTRWLPVWEAKQRYPYRGSGIFTRFPLIANLNHRPIPLFKAPLTTRFLNNRRRHRLPSSLSLSLAYYLRNKRV